MTATWRRPLCSNAVSAIHITVATRATRNTKGRHGAEGTGSLVTVGAASLAVRKGGAISTSSV